MTGQSTEEARSFRYYRVGDLTDNWFFGNEFVGVANDAQVYGRYLGDSTQQISIFDYSDHPATIYSTKLKSDDDDVSGGSGIRLWMQMAAAL